MKTQNLIKKNYFKFLLVVGIMSSAVATFAQQLTAVSDVAKSIEFSHLTPGSISEIRFDEINQMGRQEQVLSGFYQGELPPGMEGLPTIENGASLKSDALENYPLSRHLENALDYVRMKTSGESWSYLLNRAYQIVAISQRKSSSSERDEFLVRITLNRAIDIVNSTLSIIGYNNEDLAKALSIFLKMNYNLALDLNKSYRIPLYKGINQYGDNPCRYLSIAEFGRVYSNMLYSFSPFNMSPSAQAILLMKTIGYLSYDIQFANVNKNSSINHILGDIYLLQNDNPNYQLILQDLKSNVAVGTQSHANNRRANVGVLRKDVEKILINLTRELNQSGICPLGQ